MPPNVSLHLPTRPPEGVRLPSSRAFARILERAGAAAGEVNLVLTSDREVRRLNREFLGKDSSTDVLAFDYLERRAPGSPSESHTPTTARETWRPAQPTSQADAGRSKPRRAARAGGDRRTKRRGATSGEIWGDVFVSAETALAQASERGIAPREELARLFLHGALHLLGYRDDAALERARMEALQEALLRELLRGGGPRRARTASAPRRR